MYSVINLLDIVNVICFLIFSNFLVFCFVGMYFLGGRFENCIVCLVGNVCFDFVGVFVVCIGGKYFFDSYSNGCCS